MKRCCSQRVSGRHSMRYGSTGCDLSTQLQILADAIEQANALGLYNDSNVVLAQSVYNVYNGTTVSSAIAIAQTDCGKASSDIGSAIGAVQGVIIAVNGSLPTAPAVSPGLSAGAFVGIGLGVAWAAWWGLTR